MSSLRDLLNQIFTYASKYTETFAPKSEKSSSCKWKAKEEVAKKNAKHCNVDNVNNSLSNNILMNVEKSSALLPVDIF